MQDAINQLRAEIEACEISTQEQLNQFYIAYLGRKSQLNDVFDQLKTVPQQQRRAMGQALNELKQLAITRYENGRMAWFTPAQITPISDLFHKVASVVQWVKQKDTPDAA